MIGQTAKLPTSRGAAETSSEWGGLEEGVDEEGDRSFLLPFGLEPKDDKTKKNSFMLRRKMYIVIGAVAGSLCLMTLVLGLGLYLVHRSRVTLITHNCPADLQIQPTDQIFFVIGDWGRSGNANQVRSTLLMEEVARKCMKPEFIISTGDNFYPHGLSSDHDPLMATSFINVYTDENLKVPWHAVLGNHDYGDTSVMLGNCAPQELSACQPGCCTSPHWQATDSNHSSLSSLDGRWHLEQGAYQAKIKDLEITFIDTSPLLSSYKDEHWASLPGGISSQDTAQQRAHLESLLNTSAKLKIVVGHHPTQSYGKHCTKNKADCDEVSDWLTPLLHKYKVMAYLSGHEHSLQFIKRTTDPVSYVISGAGSDLVNVEVPEAGTYDGRVHVYNDQGFVAGVVRDNVITFYYWTASSPDPVVMEPIAPL